MTLTEMNGTTGFLDLFTNINNVFGPTGIASLLGVAWLILTVTLSAVTHVSTAMIAASFVMIFVSASFAINGLINILVVFGFIIMMAIIFFLKLFKDF